LHAGDPYAGGPLTAHTHASRGEGFARARRGGFFQKALLSGFAGLACLR